MAELVDKKKESPFSGMFNLENVLTTEKLKARNRAERSALRANRLSALGPQNTLAMQFGEALGNLVRKKAGYLNEDERRATANSQVLTAGLSSAMNMIEEQGIAVGSDEAQQIILQQQLEEAFNQKNMEVADAVMKKMDAMEERELAIAKTRADMSNTRSQIIDRRERRELAMQELAVAQATAKMERRDKLRAAANDSAVALRKETDAKIEGAVGALAGIKRAEALASQGTPASDIGLIMAALKTFDPGARVTDQDFKTMKDARETLYAAYKENKLSEAAWGKIEKYLSAQKLLPKQRLELVNAVRVSGLATLDTAVTDVEYAVNQANRMGYDVQTAVSGSARQLLTAYDKIVPFGEDAFDKVGWDNQDALRGLLIPEAEQADTGLRQLKPMPTQ